jgi:opacity protein-like surface antigen
MNRLSLPSHACAFSYLSTRKYGLFVAALLLSASALAQTTPPNAQAQETKGAYASIGIVISTLKETVGTAYSTRPALVIATLGYDLHPYLGLEAQFGMGVAKGNATLNSSNIRTSINSVIGIYLKPQYAITPKLKVYGKVGRAEVRMSSTAPNTASQSFSGSGNSYGLGASYEFSEDLSATLEYMSYLKAKKENGGRLNLSGIQLGLELRY